MPLSTFGQRISEAREAAGLSRRELAKRMQVSYYSIRYWELGEKQPRGHRLLRLAKSLEVPVVYLLKGKQPGYSQKR